jgi:hypothetical protein
MIEIGTRDGRVVQSIIWEEPEAGVIGVVQCLSCGLGAPIRNGSATEIASDILAFSTGHPCVQSS